MWMDTEKGNAEITSALTASRTTIKRFLELMNSLDTPIECEGDDIDQCFLKYVSELESDQIIDLNN